MTLYVAVRYSHYEDTYSSGPIGVYPSPFDAVQACREIITKGIPYPEDPDAVWVVEDGYGSELGCDHVLKCHTTGAIYTVSAFKECGCHRERDAFDVMGGVDALLTPEGERE